MPIYQDFNDAELTALLKEGDRDAFTEIYNRYHWLLHIHTYKWIRNREEAKDIIHELFSTIWMKHDQLSFGPNLSTYLYAAVRNRIFNLLSHKKIESAYIVSLGSFIEKGECVTDHLVRESQLSKVIEKQIAAMPLKMRHVFELSRKQNYSHKKIAYELDISEQTVRKHIQHALKVLRFKLGIF
ncbi:sigma-70 family RNA polymerase sigma factor [Pedobacter sp. SD-b]|uniref:Sigma-70 family RNA polymerase sigma factor n=1 Tax=Pedobacter segetis TaxID=2793069 RepID=A0ABS1BL79_9SPHI|nr:sigma-70 family RNA polymerase sigma factor [Pedobacter segetis]MBK0383644.1 sigma-70 family RNA polymerase sigma factor [Pedobacter segetis]